MTANNDNQPSPESTHNAHATGAIVGGGPAGAILGLLTHVGVNPIRLVLSGLSVTGLTLIGLALAVAPPAKVEPGASVTYFASAGEGDKWNGNAPIESVALEFDPGRPLETSFRATLRPDRFDSGNGIRDATSRENVFQTGEYPEVTLASLEVTGDPKRLPIGEARTFKVRAKLTLHGVTREVDLSVRAVWNGAKLSATTGLRLNLSDYRMARPQFLFIKVDDPVRLEVNLEASPR
jgi:polyisoprenoid-binding protein YceI